MTIHERIVSDGIDVADDSTKPVEVPRMFCWTGHVHFVATSLEDARAKLAAYFNARLTDESADQMFEEGQMTLGAALVVHHPQANSEIKH